MITKEIVRGEEVFAVDEPTGVKCSGCVSESSSCDNAPCVSDQRTDRRNVLFHPITDLRTLAAYHAQEHRDVQ